MFLFGILVQIHGNSGPQPIKTLVSSGNLTQLHCLISTSCTNGHFSKSISAYQRVFAKTDAEDSSSHKLININQHQSTSVNPLIHASPHYDRYDRAFRLELVSSNLQHWLLDSIRDGPIENKPIKNQNHFSQPETHVMFSDSRHIM